MRQNASSGLTKTRTTRIAVDVGIIVANMDRALAFYRDLLRLTVVAELTTSLIGKGRMVQLRHGESLIKLVELEESPVHHIPTGLSSSLGYRYVTLLVTDIDTMMTRLAQANVVITVPVTQLGNGANIAMVADPDGNIIEFVQENASKT
ncbi:MAG: VOC family protein [Leptolyngbya sp. SIO3F4]|nr:VOC family protein [Leptolyngbya sp. SIO3F4]